MDQPRGVVTIPGNPSDQQWQFVAEDNSIILLWWHVEMVCRFCGSGFISVDYLS